MLSRRNNGFTAVSGGRIVVKPSEAGQVVPVYEALDDPVKNAQRRGSPCTEKLKQNNRRGQTTYSLFLSEILRPSITISLLNTSIAVTINNIDTAMAIEIDIHA